MRPWRTLFRASSVVCKGPISKELKSQFTKPPFEKNLGIFTSTASNFCPNFSSQAPKFENFSSQTSLSEAKISSQAPHFGNPGRTPLPEKKLSAPQVFNPLYMAVKCKRQVRIFQLYQISNFLSHIYRCLKDCSMLLLVPATLLSI